MAPPLLVAATLIFTIFFTYAPIAEAQKYMEVTLSGSSNPDQQFIQAGWQAAAKKASMSTVTSSFTSGAGLGSSISAAVKDAGALAVFGLYDDDATLSLMNSNDFTNANLVLFGPYTQSTGVRYWSNNVYFMSADPMTELVSLLNWAVANTVPLSNTGYMTLSSNLETGSIQGILTNQLLMLGLSPPVTYIEESTSAYNSASFSTLMAQNPTSMFVFGARGTHTTTFFQNLVQNSYVADSSNNFYVMLPFALMYTTSTAYQTLQLAGTTRIPMGNIRYSYPLPAPSDTTFGAGSTFSSAMSSSNTAYTASTLSTTSGYLSFYGWLFIQQILYIGNTYNLGGSLNYAGLKSNVFLQNRYIFNDIVLGNYGGECPNAKAMQLGAACSCNQGGHLITITKITGIAAANLPTSSGVTLATDTQYIYPTTPCYGSNLNVTAKIASLAAGVIVVPSSATSSISTQVLASFSATSDRTTFSRISPLVFTVSSVTATATTTLQTVQTQFATKGLRVLAGPFAAPFQPETMSNFLILDPITIPPPLVRAYAPNVMYLSSSIQQEIYTAASYLGSSSMLAAKPDVHVRVRSENNTFVLNAVYGSLGYFGVKLTSAAGVGATVNMVSEIPTSGYTFVVGLQASEVASLKSFLSANANAYVIMWFDEFTVLYDTFLSEFTLTESAYMSQLLFSTNVPLWTQSGTGSLSQTFVSKVAAAGQTPAGMRAFLAAMVIDQITQTSTNISWAALQQQMTDKALFSVNNVPLGPYYSNCIAMPKTAVDECNSYTGARVLSLWSYKSVASPSTASLFSPGYQPMFYSEVQHATLEPTTQTSTTATPSTSTTTTSTTTTVMPTRLSPCGVLTTTSNPFTTKLHTTTTAPPKSGGGGGSSDAGLYAAIAIVAVLVVAAALIAIQLSCMVLPCCVSNTFETAPCDGDASTAVVFAEVEKWKEVQRAVPEAASECIAEYRSVVRRLVVKYQCYEAGAFGDAFMVVAREPYRAVKFAVGLQKEMDAMRGPSVDAVDSAYASLGLSSGAVRGLRVRVGVHTDVVDIAYDVDTDHYEYRGAGCIAALRTERLAHGGQVLVTGATCESLTEKQLAGVHAVSLGSQQFQEYEEPVSVFEVVALPHREFGSTSRGGALAVDDPVLSLCSDTSAIGAVDPTSFSLSREVLMLAVSAMPLKQRLIVLLGKCEERGLRIPRRGKGSTDERYADSLLNMLAQCMATPAIKRESIMGGTSQDAKWHGESPMSKPAPEVVMNTGGVNDDNSSSEDETNENTH